MGRALVSWGLGLALSLAAGCGSDGTSNEEGKSSADAGICGDGTDKCLDDYGTPICPVKSGYPGDELAVCQPKSVEEGLLLHWGPKNYDKAEMAKYTLPAYGEDESCIFVRTTNTEPVYINAYHGRMRPNSHHLIVTMPDKLPDGVQLGELTSCSQTDAIGARWLLGSQDDQIDMEVQGNSPGSKPAVKGDPEYGAGQLIPPHTLLRLDLHYVNTTDKEILREAWVFLQTTKKENVTQLVDMITMFQGEITVPPDSKGTTTKIARCLVPNERYVGMVTGHFHKNGTRFSVWYTPVGGERRLVYQTKDWDSPGNAWFTKRIENPKLNGPGVWGAQTGYLKVKQGDYIEFQCEYDNPTDTTVTLGEKGKDQMCNVFGVYYPTDGNVWNCVCVGESCL